jgi:uncharacterized protein YcgI (DUF1989 family)
LDILMKPTEKSTSKLKRKSLLQLVNINDNSMRSFNVNKNKYSRSKLRIMMNDAQTNTNKHSYNNKYKRFVNPFKTLRF